ncbi:MAG: hypothetical protein R3349_11960, partial [Geminicoccaceae bacterium]|nr:hypothetical protein [Geminicoccaceae bacterium]
VTFLEEVRSPDFSEIMSGKARMTQTHVTLAAASEDLTARSAAPCHSIEISALEPLISAALLTTTAFRLRDRQGLDDALRLLVAATDEVERTVLETAA